ncbi:SDR family oxidoreductase [Kitasatospora purpeofusca]|uniref:SDR family oxidoreductase n=1 Tax=Kitasatospora purpeofusca TaxID=67352 RepID=UPI002E153824|nr:SDR family oxidoreductase [Kitasatospora purpeofusca]
MEDLEPTTRTVVITGASAGIGRACVAAFAARGDRLALIARGRAGLDAAEREARLAGAAEVITVETDVADAQAVETAARLAEEALGPIDVWVNTAFASVLAPFTEITPEEFRRVTEVSYLGHVFATRAALARMLPRDAGVVVQVGSAIAYRGIPLQSACSGAKHAVQGFNEALRCELLASGTRVRTTMVQLPAVNTPQFDWVRSRLPERAQPVPPIFQPEVAARAVLFAADHPKRREYWVGASTAATLVANAVVPGLLDRYLARTGFSSQQDGRGRRTGDPDNLFSPVDAGRDFGAHGRFDDRAHDRSFQQRASHALGGLTDGVRRVSGRVATGLPAAAAGCLARIRDARGPRTPPGTEGVTMPPPAAPG